MSEISIIGATFYGNRGAEAMLSTTIGRLRETHPDTMFNVFSYYAQQDRQLVGDPAIRFYSSSPAYLVAVLNPFALLYGLLGLLRLRPLQRLCPQSVQALARSRALVCLAGVSFVDGRTKFLPFNIATILPAMLVGTPVVKFAQALGTFTEMPNRLAARMFLPLCRRVFARGAGTLENLRGLLGEAPNVERANDVAFLFSPDLSLSRRDETGFAEGIAAMRARRNDGTVVVGLCPSVVVAKKARKAGWDYAAMLADIVRAATGRGWAVALFPNATRSEPDVEHNNDLPLLKDVLSRLSAGERERVIPFTGLVNAAQVHEVIATCDVVLVSRFHAMVGALSIGVPVAVMGWSHKYREVMELFGQEDMVLRYEKGEAADVLAGLGDLVVQREARAAAIAAAAPAVRTLSRRQLDYVAALL